MEDIAGPEFVRAQYQTTDSLNARQSLHGRFSASTLSWYDWTLSKLDATPRCEVLDIGCGPGRLWSNGRHERAGSCALTLADSSAAMLSQARHAVKQAHLVRTSADALPFENDTFDKVVANHMLYHVPAMDEAVREFDRVLDPAGRLFVATNGRRHLQELWALLAEHGFQIPQTWHRLDFDTGVELLARHFRDVRTHRFEDHLAVTEVEPLVDYVRSLGVVPDAVLAPVASHARDCVDAEGAFRISKDPGILIASDPRR